MLWHKIIAFFAVIGVSAAANNEQSLKTFYDEQLLREAKPATKRRQGGRKTLERGQGSQNGGNLRRFQSGGKQSQPKKKAV